METISALDAKNKFGQLLESAQRSPVMVTKKGRPSVVVLSASAYEKRRQYALQQVQKCMDEAGTYAQSQGLTEETLNDLLADES